MSKFNLDMYTNAQEVLNEIYHYHLDSMADNDELADDYAMKCLEALTRDVNHLGNAIRIITEYVNNEVDQ